MDKNATMWEIEALASDAATYLRIGDEDGCYNTMLTLIEIAKEFVEKFDG